MSLILGLFFSVFGAATYASDKDDAIVAYFNQEPNHSYTDPYRGIERKGQNLEQVIVDHIMRAKRSIDVAVQEIRLPLIAKALIKKRDEGVRVRILLENNYHDTIQDLKLREGGSEHFSDKFVDLFAFADINKDGVLDHEELSQRDAVYMLQHASMDIKDDTADGSAGSGIMHHKFVVIDEKVVIASTANFTLSCVHGDYLRPNSRGNANSLLLFESKEMAQSFIEEFELMWGVDSGPRFGVKKTYRKAQEISIGDELTRAKVQFSPTSRRRYWEESVNGLIGRTIGKAKNQVYMALFVFSEQRVSDILQTKRTLNKDFKIGLVMEPNFAFRYYSETLDMWGLKMLTPSCRYQSSNNPWTNPLGNEVAVANLAYGDVMHHKFAVVDDDTVIVGSQNWSESANHLNDENLLVIKNKEVAAAYLREYKRLYNRSSKGIPYFLLERIEREEKKCADDLAPYRF